MTHISERYYSKHFPIGQETTPPPISTLTNGEAFKVLLNLKGKDPKTQS